METTPPPSSQKPERTNVTLREIKTKQRKPLSIIKNSMAGGSDSTPNLSVRGNGAFRAFPGAFLDTIFTPYLVPQMTSLLSFVTVDLYS